MIEDWVKLRHPNDKDYGWFEKIPQSDWQYSKSLWIRSANEIIAIFQSKIGFDLTVPRKAKVRARGEAMTRFWIYLARKAESKGPSTVIRDMEK